MSPIIQEHQEDIPASRPSQSQPRLPSHRCSKSTTNSLHRPISSTTALTKSLPDHHQRQNRMGLNRQIKTGLHIHGKPTRNSFFQIFQGWTPPTQVSSSLGGSIVPCWSTPTQKHRSPSPIQMSFISSLLTKCIMYYYYYYIMKFLILWAFSQYSIINIYVRIASQCAMVCLQRNTNYLPLGLSLIDLASN